MGPENGCGTPIPGPLAEVLDFRLIPFSA